MKETRRKLEEQRGEWMAGDVEVIQLSRKKKEMPLILQVGIGVVFVVAALLVFAVLQ